MIPSEPIDLLQEVLDGIITPQEARDIYEESERAALSGNSPYLIFYEFMGVDDEEGSAIDLGVDIGTVASWRRDGWPSSCRNCGGHINHKKFGWIARRYGDEYGLEHVDCDDPSGKNMDLLELVHKGRITNKEADMLLLAANGAFHQSELTDVEWLLGMSNREFTAYEHGADCRAIARWRRGRLAGCMLQMRLAVAD